ncbi:hypothetical protein CUJ90_16945 [Paraburkholderia terricola]|nr:hypothetical protein CUJ90_16945 [Paraburkholderia terricola]
MMRVYENKRYCLLQQHNNTTTNQKQTTGTANFYCNYELLLQHHQIQLPTTNYQLPTTNYQLPTTNYQLPTNYQDEAPRQTIHGLNCRLFRCHRGVLRFGNNFTKVSQKIE